MGMLPVTTFTSRPSLISLASMLVGEGSVNVRTGLPYGPEPSHRLDLYEPNTTAENRAVAPFLYGGGWRSGHRGGYGFVGAALASRGIATAVADYRLFPDARWPAFQQDAAAAFGWVRRALANDGTRPAIIIGHSAGAHLGAMLAYDPRWLGADRPDAFVGLSGPYTFEPTRWPTTAEIFATATNPDDPRPVAYADASAPPSLLVHGADDVTVKQANTVEMAARLAQVGAPVKTLILPGCDHKATVLGFVRPLRRTYPVLDPIATFIATVEARAIRSAKSAASASRRAD